MSPIDKNALYQSLFKHWKSAFPQSKGKTNSTYIILKIFINVSNNRHIRLIAASEVQTSVVDFWTLNKKDAKTIDDRITGLKILAQERQLGIRKFFAASTSKRLLSDEPKEVVIEEHQSG